MKYYAVDISILIDQYRPVVVEAQDEEEAIQKIKEWKEEGKGDVFDAESFVDVEGDSMSSDPSYIEDSYKIGPIQEVKPRVRRISSEVVLD